MAITIGAYTFDGGDLVEVRSDEEVHRSRLKLLNGLHYVGPYGASLEFYVKQGFTVEMIDRARGPVDQGTARMIADWLRGRGHFESAHLVKAEFLVVSDD